MDSFQELIYHWYNRNARLLPWRSTKDPYHIWLSEIILQQTRVNQGLKYYYSFLEHFPNLLSLAQAEEDQILKLWQGLGYYSRARNLHKAAKELQANYKGDFPKSYRELLKLKGIGPYTAAAIASFAFNLPHATLDGNVFRFLSRYFGISTPIDSKEGKKEFSELAQSLISIKDPALHNQAFMEFGALQCSPKSPDCMNCPVQSSCAAFEQQNQNELPVKTSKTKQRHRYFYYYYIDEGEFMYIKKRTHDDIWKNLYELPLQENNNKLNDNEVLTQTNQLLEDTAFNLRNYSQERKHILSHQIIHAWVIHLEIAGGPLKRSDWKRINKKDIFKFAVPKLLELFFEDLQLI